MIESFNVTEQGAVAKRNITINYFLQAFALFALLSQCPAIHNMILAGEVHGFEAERTKEFTKYLTH